MLFQGMDFKWVKRMDEVFHLVMAQSGGGFGQGVNHLGTIRYILSSPRIKLLLPSLRTPILPGLSLTNALQITGAQRAILLHATKKIRKERTKIFILTLTS
jgi:hypothetical protein